MAMKVTVRKRKLFREFYELNMFRMVAATKNQDTGRWRLFGIHNTADAAVFVEAARGGVREWSSLEHLADFCYGMGIERWEVHNKIHQ